MYVTNAVEGDVLELLDNGKQYRARITGIDAPASPPKKPGDKPKPGPLYCRVEVEGMDLAVAQLEAGNARYSPKHVFGVNAEHQKRYQQAESKAKDAKLGVWGN